MIQKRKILYVICFLFEFWNWGKATGFACRFGDLLKKVVEKGMLLQIRASAAGVKKAKAGPVAVTCCNMRGEREGCHTGENGQTFLLADHLLAFFNFFLFSFFGVSI